MFYGAVKSSNYEQHDDVYDAVNSYNYTENCNVLCFMIPPSTNAKQDNVYDIVIPTIRQKQTEIRKSNSKTFFYNDCSLGSVKTCLPVN